MMCTLDGPRGINGNGWPLSALRQRPTGPARRPETDDDDQGSDNEDGIRSRVTHPPLPNAGFTMLAFFPSPVTPVAFAPVAPAAVAPAPVAPAAVAPAAVAPAPVAPAPVAPAPVAPAPVARPSSPSAVDLQVAAFGVYSKMYKQLHVECPACKLWKKHARHITSCPRYFKAQDSALARAARREHSE